MILGLTVKNKMGFVDDTLPQPSNNMWHSWIVCNSVVKAWILNALSKEKEKKEDQSNSRRVQNQETKRKKKKINL